MIFHTNLFDKVLLSDVGQCDTLKVISGFATPTMVTRHIEELKKNKHNLKIELIVGMVSEVGINEKHHKLFQELMENNDNKFKCSYFSENFKHIHSKLYIWCNNNVPVKAYIGSANYTQNAFFGERQGEIIAACDPSSSLDYYQKIETKSIYCTHQESDQYITKPLNP